MAGFDIDFGLLGNTNILGEYAKGQERAQQRRMDQNTLARQAEQDAMQREQFAFQKREYEEGRKDKDFDRQAKGREETYKLTRGITTPEQWEAAKRNPRFRQGWDAIAAFVGQPGDLDNQKFEDLQSLHKNMAPAPKYGFQSLGDGGLARTEETSGDFKVLREPAPKPFEMNRENNYYVRDDGQGGAPAAGGPTPPARAAGLYRDAIANIESRGSGDYKAQGPVTGTGDRAYGRYQVMGANIPQWTREALGREMTPQEFLASPEAQDAVFDHRFGGYVQKYGSPEEAASVWFTGQPRSKGGSRRDQLGTTGDQYVQKFAQNMAAPAMPGQQTATDAPQIPGYRQIQVGRQTKEWQPDGRGFLVNEKGDVKRDPRAAETVPTPPGMTPAGNGYFKNKRGQLFAIDKTGKPTQVDGPTDATADKSVRSVQVFNNALSALDKVDEQLKKTQQLGPHGKYVLNPKEFAQLEVYVRDMQLQLKEAANLGALTGPDMQFIDAMAGDPGKLKTALLQGTLFARLQALSRGLGDKYRAETLAYRSMGGDSTSMPGLYRSPRTKITADREGYGARPQGGDRPPLSAFQR